MARIRSVHPSLFTNEAWVSCQPLARILFIGLWTDADDQGVFEWKPLQIKMRLLAADAADTSELLADLERAGLVRRFTARGMEFGGIRDFQKVQRPQKPNAVHFLPDDMCEFVGVEGDYDLTDTLRRRLCEKQGFRCFYCETEISSYSKRVTSCEIDHRVPKVRGGTDDEENLVAACRACNRGKCDRSEEEWRAILVSRAPKDLFGNANPVIPNPMEGRMEDGGERRGKRASAPRRPEIPIPDGFPTDEDTRWAADQVREAGAKVDVTRCAQRIRNWALQNDRRYRDWPATWRNWIIREIEQAPKSNVVELGVPIERQRAWMQDWLEHPNWWQPGQRGPNPTEVGCKISAEVMAEFGFTPPGRRTG